MNINGLTDLDNLEKLDLSGNEITVYNDLRSIQSMCNLKYLSLKGNPICLQVDFPAKVFVLQPALQQIDDW